MDVGFEEAQPASGVTSYPPWSTTELPTPTLHLIFSPHGFQAGPSATVLMIFIVLRLALIIG